MAQNYINSLVHYLQILVLNCNLGVARLFSTLQIARPLEPTTRKQITYFLMAGDDDRRPELSYVLYHIQSLSCAFLTLVPVPSGALS